MMQSGKQQAEALSLRGQVAVVTGATGGIGKQVARRLAAIGATVVLTARNRGGLAEIEAAIKMEGRSAQSIVCELGDADAIAGLGKKVAEDYGRCDILVNNAGIGLPSKPLIELAPEEWDRMMSINLRAPYLMIRALAPLMTAARSGHIINISSLAGKNPLPNAAAYAASKWGLNGLTYSVAEELRSFNVRVTAIAPGSVDTNFGSASTDVGAQANAEKRPARDRSKMLRPDDVANAVIAIVTEGPNAFISEVLLRPATKP